MHQREKARWLKHLDFMILDIITAEVCFLVVCHIRMRVMHWRYSEIYRSTQIMLLMLAFFVVALLPLHKNILKRGPMHELIESTKYASILAIGIMLYHYLTKRGTLFSRSIFLIFWVSTIVLVWIVRSIYKLLLKKVFLERVVLPDMVLMTGSERAAENFKSLTKYGRNRYRIGGVLIMLPDGSFAAPAEDLPGAAASAEDAADVQPQADAAGADPAAAQPEAASAEGQPEAEPTEIFGIPRDLILGDLDSFDVHCLNHPVDEVFIDLDQQPLENKVAKDLITQGITVHIALTKQFKGLPNQEIETYGGRSVMTSAVQTVSAGKLMVKRIMDIAGALVGLILTAIAFVIFAPIIYHQSKGPVFYEQTRVGLNGRRFLIYKFRSMYPDADRIKEEVMKQNKVSGPMYKLDNDPRIIPIGHFIRKYSIDELPQFWNVLKGDMSLVGTRPPTEDEWKQYSPHHRARLSVKPGLTGMWQVSGRSDIVDFEKVVELDMKYIREWSLKLDCKLLLRTIRVVIRGEGAK